MNFERGARSASFDFPLVAQETIEELDEQHARARSDYETWKRDLFEWLSVEGKDPDRLRGVLRRHPPEHHLQD